MRHYYDSLSFPFLTDLLFDQLTNWDWANTRKEIEEAKKKEAEAGSVYSPEVFNKNIKLFSPTFELVDDPDNSLGKKYLYKTMVPKELKPEDIKIDATDGELYIAYKVKTKTGESSSAVLETLPDDLDVESMKAVLKDGVVTITAEWNPKMEDPEPEEEEETEYEIEIGK